jgi:cytochrome c oxidase subunit 1
MKNIFDKPYLLFLVTIPAILLIGFSNRDSVLDINLYDTYYIIGYAHLTTLLAILFGIVAIEYWVIHRLGLQISPWLKWIHIGSNLGGTLLVFILSQLFKGNSMEFEFNNSLTVLIAWIVLMVILEQIIFLIQMVYVIIKRL